MYSPNNINCWSCWFLTSVSPPLWFPILLGSSVILSLNVGLLFHQLWFPALVHSSIIAIEWRYFASLSSLVPDFRSLFGSLWFPTSLVPNPGFSGSWHLLFPNPDISQHCLALQLFWVSTLVNSFIISGSLCRLIFLLLLVGVVASLVCHLWFLTLDHFFVFLMCLPLGGGSLYKHRGNERARHHCEEGKQNSLQDEKYTRSSVYICKLLLLKRPAEFLWMATAWRWLLALDDIIECWC